MSEVELTPHSRSSIQHMTERFLTGEMGHEEFEHFENILLNDPAARLVYIEHINVHAQLSSLGGAVDQLEDGVFLEHWDLLQRRPRYRWMIATVVACLLFAGVTVYLFTQKTTPVAEPQLVIEATPPAPPEEPAVVVGEIVSTENVIATEQQSRRDRPQVLAGEVLEILSGIAEFRLKNGVTCTLQGPGKIQFSSPDHVNLQQGVFVAHVPPAARGFTIETPQVRLVDYGTTFGVSAESNGQSQVQVFEGAVSAAPMSSEERWPGLMLTSRQELNHVSGHQPHVSHAVSEGKFLAGLNRLSQVHEIQGSIQHVQMVPTSTRPGDLRSNSVIHLISEKTGVEIPHELKVIPPTLGELTKEDHCIEATLPAGTRCSSVLLHCQLSGNTQGPLSGTVRFKQPILGVVLSTEGLFESDRHFARADMQYPSWEEVVEKKLSRGSLIGFQGGTDRGDVIHVHDDQHTLSVKLNAGGGNLDQIRVLLKAPD